MQMEMQMQMAKPEGGEGCEGDFAEFNARAQAPPRCMLHVVVVVVATYIWQPLSTPFGNSRFICM